MIKENLEWYKEEGASNEDIRKLKSVCEVELPQEYFDLLAYSDGGEGPLPVEPYNLCLDSAKIVTQNLIDKTFEEFFSGFIIFGGDGGGSFIAFDKRSESSLPIVALDSTNINLNESTIQIAESFSEFIRLIGHE